MGPTSSNAVLAWLVSLPLVPRTTARPEQIGGLLKPLVCACCRAQASVNLGIDRSACSIPDSGARQGNGSNSGRAGPMSEVTELLESLGRGEPKAADQLLPLVYDELRRLAAYKMADEPPGQTLQPTALVHEAWLRLAGSERQCWQNRGHFIAVAAEAMRRVLIDRARRRQRLRHGGGQQRVDIDEVDIATPVDDERLLRIHDALDLLAAEDGTKAEVVKLKFFVGLTDREVADALGLSERTVERFWAYAKVWLLRTMQNAD